MISRKGKEDKAPSRFPAKSCHVPKLITAREKKIIKIAAGLFIGGIVTNMNALCPYI
jgi:hypothetical protein